MTDRSFTTARLALAPHGLDDFADMVAMWADPRTLRFLGGTPATTEDTWGRLLRLAGTWTLLDYGFWAVRNRETGAFVGSVGYLDGRREGVDGFFGDPEIGWALATSAQGQGFATEAVDGALAWGAGRFKRTVAMIHPENAASVTVAARCGFRHFAVARYKDAPTGLWEYRWPV